MSEYKGRTMKSKETVISVQENTVTDFAIPSRGINKDTVQHYGIRCSFNTSSGQPEGYYFPVTKAGKITGYIKCTPSLPKNNGRFSMIGDVSTNQNELLGQAKCKSGDYKIFIVEGFWDILTAFQVLKVGGKGRLPNVVSPALGIGNINSKKGSNAKQHLASNIKFLNTFKEITVCFDNDQGDINIGQAGVKDCAVLLEDFNNVVLPMNDCNEMLEAGRDSELFKLLAFGNTKYELGEISTEVKDLQVLLTPLEKGVHLNCIKKTSDLLNGLRPSEFTVVLGPPKCGKTTVCKAINYELLRAGQSVFGVYLEEDLKKTHQSMIALQAKVHLPEFRADPSIADPESIKEGVDLINSKNCMFWDSDAEGKLSPSRVIPLFKWAAMKGANYIIFDHLSFVFSGDSGTNERREIDNLLTEMAAFVKSSGVHVIAVAHIKRTNNYKPPVDKNGETIYPHWFEVDETDGRGSGAFEQICHNMILIDKQINKDKSRGLSRLKVPYNREWDRTGITDYLTLDKITGRLQTKEDDNF